MAEVKQSKDEKKSNEDLSDITITLTSHSQPREEIHLLIFKRTPTLSDCRVFSPL